MTGSGMAKKQSPAVQGLNRRLLRLNRLVSQAVERAVRSIVDQDEKLAALAAWLVLAPAARRKRS